MESASWQRPLYGFEISQNQAKMPLKSGFSDGLGGVKMIIQEKVYIILSHFPPFSIIILKTANVAFVACRICRMSLLLRLRYITPTGCVEQTEHYSKNFESIFSLFQK